MKTNILYSAAFALLVSSILSSCAFMQKGEFAQRKYYNFPRTNHSVNGENTDFTAANQHANAPTVATEEKIKNPEPIVTASAGEKNIIVSKHRSAITGIEKKAENITNETTSPPADSPVFSYKPSDIRKLAREKSNDSKLPDAGAMLLITILAAIILPPLGIFIKENWRTNKWFWVTAILCLITAIGFNIASYFWGLWVVAIVIALLDIFNVI